MNVSDLQCFCRWSTPGSCTWPRPQWGALLSANSWETTRSPQRHPQPVESNRVQQIKMSYARWISAQRGSESLIGRYGMMLGNWNWMLVKFSPAASCNPYNFQTGGVAETFLQSSFLSVKKLQHAFEHKIPDYTLHSLMSAFKRQRAAVKWENRACYSCAKCCTVFCLFFVKRRVSWSGRRVVHVWVYHSCRGASRQSWWKPKQTSAVVLWCASGEPISWKEKGNWRTQIYFSYFVMLHTFVIS